jgi:uncharacterized protein YraI
VSKGLLSLAVLFVLVLPALVAAQLAGRSAKISGESFVNLRAGPDISHPATEILREGQEVRVEKQEGNWYLVSLPDGTRGYVHHTLLRATEPPPAKAPRETGETKEAVTAPVAEEETAVELPAPPASRVAAQVPKGRPLPIIKVLEGREGDLLGWFGLALCVFILGWICGGNYYLRRDRIKRTKIRF